MLASRTLFKKTVGTGVKALFPLGRCMGTVADQTIHITFVDSDGNRASVPALVGKTVLSVAEQHRIDLEGPCRGGGGTVAVQRTELWHDDTYGTGPTCFYCHVQIPSTYNNLLPPMGETDMKGINLVWDDEEVTAQSRLGCQIKLEKKHDGMVVFVPDAPPTLVL